MFKCFQYFCFVAISNSSGWREFTVDMTSGKGRGVLLLILMVVSEIVKLDRLVQLEVHLLAFTFLRLHSLKIVLLPFCLTWVNTLVLIFGLRLMGVLMLTIIISLIVLMVVAGMVSTVIWFSIGTMIIILMVMFTSIISVLLILLTFLVVIVFERL